MALSQTSIDTGSKQVTEACSIPDSKDVAQELRYYRHFCMQELEYMRRTADQTWNLNVDDDVASEENQGKPRLSSPTLTAFSSHSAEIDTSSPGDEKKQLGSLERVNCIDDLEPNLNASGHRIPSATSTRFSSNVTSTRFSSNATSTRFSSCSAETDSSSSHDEGNQLWLAERVNCIDDLEPYLNALGYRMSGAKSSRFSSNAAEIDSSSSDDEEYPLWSQQERVNCIDDLTPYLTALEYQ